MSILMQISFHTWMNFAIFFYKFFFVYYYYAHFSSLVFFYNLPNWLQVFFCWASRVIVKQFLLDWNFTKRILFVEYEKKTEDKKRHFVAFFILFWKGIFCFRSKFSWVRLVNFYIITWLTITSKSEAGTEFQLDFYFFSVEFSSQNRAHRKWEYFFIVKYRFKWFKIFLPIKKITWLMARLMTHGIWSMNLSNFNEITPILATLFWKKFKIKNFIQIK